MERSPAAAAPAAPTLTTALDLDVTDRAAVVLPGPATPLAHRRTLTVGALDDAADHVLLLDPSGRVELAIRITAEGPVLQIDALALRMKARDIVLECDTLRADAAQRIDLSSSGDIVANAAGKHHTTAGGGVRLAGRDVSVAAERGEMSLRATEDLRVDGATVLINC